MSKRIEFIDLIKSMLAKLVVGTLAEYSSDFDVADYTDNTLPSWKKTKDYADANVPAGVSDTAEIGDPNPIVIPFSVGLCPFVSAVTDLTTDGTNTIRTNEQVTLIYRLVYTDNTKTVLQSVNIYGEDDGSGNLAKPVTYLVFGIPSL